MFEFHPSKVATIKNDVLSGVTVALALVPEAIAFAFVAGVEPLVGLYAAFMVGLITACIGGRPGMISGATGALAVVMVALVADHGVEYLFATVVLMGILQILAGAFKLGKFTGEGLICGCSVIEQPIIGSTYLVKLTGIVSKEYPFDTIACSEIHLTKV